MEIYVFEKHFDGDDLKNAILAPTIYCHDPLENQIYTVVLSVMLNSFTSMSLSKRSTVKPKVDKNELTFDLRR